MTTETALSPALMEKTLIGGDLAKLTPGERLAFYSRVCESIGLNPLTRPFAYITLNNRLTLYATRDCTDQLRKLHGVSVEIIERTRSSGSDVVVVRAKATIGSRADESLGAVSVAGLKGEALANCLMKAETKAKRRVTLSICGLGFLDEHETETIPIKTTVDPATGEILEHKRLAESEGDVLDG
jgi:hypothetical protein